MKILVTGGCGFLGSNLVSYGILKGFDITVFDNLSRKGASKNLIWLESIGEFTYKHGDIRNKNDVETVIRFGDFDAIFHLAGQVAMTTSIENPQKDFEVNTMGTLNVLEAVRKYSQKTAVFYSSTNKVYGDLEQYNYIENSTRYICKEFSKGFSEVTPLDFRSPYGCSKGAADQYMLDYNRIFGLKTVVFRHSSMYGGRQYASSDQGWVGWFCEKAFEKKRNSKSPIFTISGNGKQVRDILHADDMISLYYTCLEKINVVSGHSFNIGGGMQQSLSLLELFEILENKLNIKLTYKKLPFRKSDQKVFVADINKITKLTGWEPKVTSLNGITRMIEWIEEIL